MVLVKNEERQNKKILTRNCMHNIYKWRSGEFFKK